MIKDIKSAPARSIVTFRNGNTGIVDMQHKVYDLDGSKILTGYDEFDYHPHYKEYDIIKVTDPEGKIIYQEEIWETVDMNKLFEKLNSGKQMAFRLHYEDSHDTYCHCNCLECDSTCRFEDNTRSGSGNITLSDLMMTDKIEILE